MARQLRQNNDGVPRSGHHVISFPNRHSPTNLCSVRVATVFRGNPSRLWCHLALQQHYLTSAYTGCYPVSSPPTVLGVVVRILWGKAQLFRARVSAATPT